jgi:hypothetical protein
MVRDTAWNQRPREPHEQSATAFETPHCRLPWSSESEVQDFGTSMLVGPDRYYIGTIGSPFAELASANLANAAFIVLACNAHDDLVAALRDLRTRFHAACLSSGSDAWAADAACRKADAALVKAGAA